MKKVFPMDPTIRTARQRADQMLARANGLVNGREEPSTYYPPQQSAEDFDDDQSQVTICSR